jgi:penicillin G amidase
MKWIRPILLGLLSGVLFFLLNFKHDGDIPPPGKVFNPFAGFWQNNRSIDELPTTLDLPGLQDTVRIVWDDRRVPHIFAANTHDLFFAQGYCIARDRLWQMDFQSRAAAGRLSEVIGPRTLELDRFHRRIGLNLSAEFVMQKSLLDPFMRVVMEAFRDGANSWIRNLNEREFPVEFKILDYRPEEWTVLKSALIFSNFSLTLAFSNSDAALTRVRDILGDSVTSILYPDILPFVDPIIPRGTRWDFVPHAVPSPANRNTPVRNHTSNVLEPPVPQELSVGSNNWALSGSRTASGRPILCSDPHLGITLPSIWYEIQMASPGMNVYGVTSPGSPGVLIGFNKRIAFGETNAGSDVLDWYEITFRDSTLNEYLYDGAWRPTQKRVEVIPVRGAPSVMDTIVYTHHGPVVARPGEKSSDQRVPSGYAMRWTALDSTNGIDAFLKIDMAGTYGEFVDALAGFDCPAQNFIYADADNNIAIWHNGKLPLRWKDQGKYLCDGSSSADEWQGWVPRAHLPHVLNPPRGFVSSANQPPADSTYPYYLGWNYSGFERSTRINERLYTTEKATTKDMMALQTDVFNPRAEKALPLLLSSIDQKSLDPDEQKAFHVLSTWNYNHDTSAISPQLFEYWWREIHLGIWQDDIRQEGAPLLQPRADVLLRILLSDPQNPFVDNHGTRAVETLSDVVQQSFSEAVRKMTKDYGPLGQNWSWGATRGTTIRHLARMPGFGRPRASLPGNYNSVNAVTGEGGPSWRMVVELDSLPKGWGVYPGGQSGSPGSAYYDNFVDTWMRGEYYELVLLRGPDEQNHHVVSTTTLLRER